ncbi:MAG: methyltransferase domain-containing protein, partial [Armatimonadota bacterium]
TLKWSDQEAARIVRESYGAVVPSGSTGVADSLYTAEELAQLPVPVREMALGMGNPIRYADPRPGETVLDLGSGGGIDTLLAALRVRPTGRAVGIDFTESMLDLARSHAAMMGLINAEFVYGTLEDIPLPDASVNVAITNGVINLSTKKGRVFAECFRVLRPGGRLVFADSVIDGCLPKEVLENEAAYAG